MNGTTPYFNAMYYLDNLKETLKQYDSIRQELIHIKVALEMELVLLESEIPGDYPETYTSGYRNGHRNGRIELIKSVLEIPSNEEKSEE